MQQQEIFIKSSLDGTLQPSLFYKSDSEGKRPLLVGLHTWSYDRFNQINNMLTRSPISYIWSILLKKCGRNV